MIFRFVGILFFLTSVSVFSLEINLPDASKYTGDLTDGLFEGRGKQYWPNGDVYEGEFAKGLFSGFGTLTTLEYTYEGLFAEGLMSGEGVLRLKTGSTFYGTFENGYLKGEGKIDYYNGDKYEGSIIGSMKSGAGTYTKENGDIYVGNFKDDMFNGFGTYYEVTGNYYTGDFLNGLFNGHGIYVSKENIFKDVVYEGVFKNGNFPEKYYRHENILNTTKNILLVVMFLSNIFLFYFILKSKAKSIMPTNHNKEEK